MGHPPQMGGLLTPLARQMPGFFSISSRCERVYVSGASTQWVSDPEGVNAVWDETWHADIVIL